MRRYQEQRWILDNIVRTVGIEWDQNRIGYIGAPAGPEATPDFMSVRNRVQKFNDIPREFARAARKRETIARKAEEEGYIVSARESYFIASLLYGGAMWAIFENTSENIAYNDKKVECYQKYIQYADHEIRRVEIPFEGKSIPGYFHLPNARPAGKLPVLLSIDGMDGFKEMMHSLYGDKFLERGIACLAIDGPGQGECTVRNIHCTASNFKEVGRTVLSWLRSQPEVDPERVAVYGVSMGSFWATQIASIDERLKACCVAYVCHEPGMSTLFQSASPTFKLRYMYMAGYEDEQKFDTFATTLSVMDDAGQITCPYLVIAGEDDELSPIKFTYQLLDKVKAPKNLLIYQGEKHALHSTTSMMLGPSPHTYTADWLIDRFSDRPMETRHTFVDLAGQVHIAPWQDGQMGPI
jgi:dienelactone hydrolase